MVMPGTPLLALVPALLLALVPTFLIEALLRSAATGEFVTL